MPTGGWKGGGGGKHWGLTSTSAFPLGSSAAHPVGDASAGKPSALAAPGPRVGAATQDTDTQKHMQSGVIVLIRLSSARTQGMPSFLGSQAEEGWKGWLRLSSWACKALLLLGTAALSVTVPVENTPAQGASPQAISPLIPSSRLPLPGVSAWGGKRPLHLPLLFSTLNFVKDCL